MIKAVFFDLYNTLARFHPPRQEIQAEAAAAFGLQPDPEGIIRGYAQADQYMTEQNARLHIQKMPWEERLAFFAEYERLVLRGAGLDVPVDLARQIWQRVREVPSTLAPFDDVLPTLIELRRRQLKVGLISNMYSDLDDLCASLGIAQYLDFAVSALTAGAEKPHPPIFRAALERAGVEPQQGIHVGDQYQGDVVGARQVGMHAVLLDRDGLHRGCQDVERIGTLPEITRFLDW